MRSLVLRALAPAQRKDLAPAMQPLDNLIVFARVTAGCGVVRNAGEVPSGCSVYPWLELHTTATSLFRG